VLEQSGTRQSTAPARRKRTLLYGEAAMNLLFAINRDFTDLFLNCMHSIVLNGGEEQYSAYILHSDLNQALMDTIQDAVGDCVSCHFITVNPRMFENFPKSKRYPIQIYYRIAAPLLLPKELDRILYLDVDTVVINPLKQLYEMDFEGSYYIACTHTKEFLTKVNQTRLGIKKDVPYINTGVMMLNLPALRENLNLQDIQSYAYEKMHTFILPDQDIITALYGEKVKLVDTMQYNLSDRILAFYNANPQNKKRDVQWVRQNSTIIHYCGKNKPWKDNYAGILGTFYEELSNKRRCLA
jgi:lipopolysaccharide biosynthesis glycosyltransferase